MLLLHQLHQYNQNLFLSLLYFLLCIKLLMCNLRHLLVLEDEALIGETVREFEESGRNIEGCFQRVSARYIRAFEEIDDEYLRERAVDLRDVAQRVLQNLLGQTENSLKRLAGERIVVAVEAPER